MNALARLRLWWRQRRRQRIARRLNSPFREFVYLDEVSVYSLIASKLGPIAAEFTDTQTATLQEGLTASLGASAGVGKTEIGSNLSSSRSRSSQVLRKSTIQTTFRELRGLAESELRLVMMRGQVAPAPESIRALDMTTLLAGLQRDGWIVDPSSLARGDLFEVEVELGADDIYNVSTIISSIIELAREQPALFGVADASNLAEIEAMSRLLEKLLVGLVPVRGRCTEWSVLSMEGTDWIVNAQVLEALALRAGALARSLHVVGVLQEALFWQDIRRVLFSESRYLMMCRLGQDGISNSWTPVKLADVLATVLPDMRSVLANLGETALTAMRQSRPTSATGPDHRAVFAGALSAFVELVAGERLDELGSESIAGYVARVTVSDEDVTSLRGRRRIFRALTNQLHQDLGVELSLTDASALRTEAMLMAGLGPASGQTVSGASMAIASTNSELTGSGDVLDCEVVAIYW